MLQSLSPAFFPDSEPAFFSQLHMYMYNPEKIDFTRPSSLLLGLVLHVASMLHALHGSIKQLFDGHRNNTAHYWGSGWPDCFAFLYSSLDFVFFMDLPPLLYKEMSSGSSTLHVNNNFKKPVNPHTSFLEHYSANGIGLFQKIEEKYPINMIFNRVK